MTDVRPRSGGLWLRWSWRDLRRHWVAVVAIALVIAIGTGVFAGLGSTSTWRRQSNDESFAQLSMHDLRVELSPGTFAPEGALRAAAMRIPDAELLTGVEERLIVDSQIEIDTAGESVLTSARIVGMNVGSDASVDTLWVRDGIVPPADGRQAVLELKYAEHRDLPAAGSVTVAGGHVVDYVGLGLMPEDFFYEGPEGTLLAQGELAPLYLPVAAAQVISGRSGQVNDLVVTLADGSDRADIAAQLGAAVAGDDVSATISTREDADAVRVLYEDIDNDQQFWNMLAGLVLAAAALAAFNLTNRIVEAQRREIGIGMALGVARRKLAIRPLLLGAQIAALGTVAGIAVGLLIGQAMGGLLESFLPLPVHRTPFQFGVFAQAAILGIIVPVVACAIPTWRAVRVEPIDAIRTGHLNAKASRFTDWTGRLRLPGSSLTQMPIRNVLRTPRRSLLTAVGIGAAITAMVAVLGMLDSFERSISTANDEFTKGDSDRVLVNLDTFHPTDGPVVGAISEQIAVGAIDAGLRLPATALDPSGDVAEDLELLVELVDFETAAWTPTLTVAATQPASGVVLSPKAAADLGVAIGDSLTLRHPTRLEEGFVLSSTELTVSGIHANPMRAFAFMDLDHADLFGLDGWVNFVHAYPAEASTRTDLQLALFDLEGVTSSQSVARVGESFDEALDQFTGFLFITAGAVLILALLIAFNATRITVEERQREHATMLAFGLPVRSVMGVVVKESIVMGIAATVIGVAAGGLFLRIMLRSLADTTLPDLQIDDYLSPATLMMAATVGVIAAAFAPLLLTRRIQKMSIPDTLRTME